MRIYISQNAQRQRHNDGLLPIPSTSLSELFPLTFGLTGQSVLTKSIVQVQVMLLLVAW